MLMRGFANEAPRYYYNLADSGSTVFLYNRKPSSGFSPQRALSSLYVLLLHTPASMLRAQSSQRVFKSSQNQLMPLALAHACLPYM